MFYFYATFTINMNKQSHNTKKRLQLGKFKLDTLLEVTKGINDNLSKEELLEIYKTILLDELKIGKLLLFSFNDKETRVVCYCPIGYFLHQSSIFRDKIIGRRKCNKTR